MASKVEEKDKDKHYVRNERKRHTALSNCLFPLSARLELGNEEKPQC